jgi:DNA-binding CsgD family transcriptional regulator
MGRPPPARYPPSVVTPKSSELPVPLVEDSETDAKLVVGCDGDRWALARALSDQLAPILTTLRQRLDVAKRRSGTRREQALVESIALVDQTMGQVRELSRALSAPRAIASLSVDDVARTDREKREAADGAATLTSRQREVLRLIAEGQSTKHIARGLGISVKTVETHRAQIMERLGIRHVAGLVRYAMRVGIVASERAT